jgi:hypothetical protein
MVELTTNTLAYNFGEDPTHEVRRTPLLSTW